MARPETVVDYDAWKKGYTPPSEHILIDQLAYRGARVLMSSDMGEDLGAIWIVVRGGKKPDRPTREVMRKMMDMFLDDQLETIKSDLAVTDETVSAKEESTQ